MYSLKTTWQNYMYRDEKMSRTLLDKAKQALHAMWGPTLDPGSGERH